MWDNLLKWVAIYICLLVVVGHTFWITKFWRAWAKEEKGAFCRVKVKVRACTREEIIRSKNVGTKDGKVTYRHKGKKKER